MVLRDYGICVKAQFHLHEEWWFYLTLLTESLKLENSF